jgi:hypothetical protein
MSRPFAAAVLVAAVGALAPLGAQAPNVVTRESVVTATVDRVERGTRVVTLRGDASQVLSVYVDPTVMSIDDLHVGDLVTVRYEESVVVQLRPNAELSAPHDTTAEAKSSGRRDVVEQQTTVVTIESIDPQGLFVTYRTAGGLKAVRPVNDARLLKGLRPGDRVEVTLTRERAISITRAR